MQAHQNYRAHPAYAAYEAPERQAAIPTVFNWLKRKLEARRARLNHARDIEYLRSLDRHMLEDIGVDIASLGEVTPKLESSNPHVLAIHAICPPRNTSNSR
jgi:hypothetical protein